MPSGTVTPAGGGGGSSPSVLSSYYTTGAGFVAVADATYTELPFQHANGENCLDLAHPTHPAILIAGDYSITVSVVIDTNNAGKYAYYNLSLDEDGIGPTGQEYTFTAIMPLFSAGGFTSNGSATITKQCGVGEKLFFAVSQSSGGPINFFHQAYISRRPT